jgi:hypothetical protein
LIENRNGRLFALWSAPTSSHYGINLAPLEANGWWGEKRLVWSETKADLRFASAAFDAENRLWIAAVRIEPGRCDLAVRPADPFETSQPGGAGDAR